MYLEYVHDHYYFQKRKRILEKKKKREREMEKQVRNEHVIDITHKNIRFLIIVPYLCIGSQKSRSRYFGVLNHEGSMSMGYRQE